MNDSWLENEVSLETELMGEKRIGTVADPGGEGLAKASVRVMTQPCESL